jgi:hypothetical protein
MTDNSRRTGAAIEAHYRFVVWLVPTIDKFPKSHKFTIGDRIETAALDVLAYTKDRMQQLCCGAWHKLFGKRPRWEIWTRPMARRINAARETDPCQPNPELEIDFCSRLVAPLSFV